MTQQPTIAQAIEAYGDAAFKCCGPYEEASRWSQATYLGARASLLSAIVADRAALVEALRGIVDSGALAEVESVVAGWRGPDGQNPPHPAQLGATIRTNCGRMYKLADALAAARAALAALPQPVGDKT